MPRPQKGQTKEEFIGSYMSARNREGKHDQKQNAAIAYSIWRNRNKKKKKSESDIHRELLALDLVASEFEKEGNLDAGKIITEAMKKIAENDFGRHL